VVHARFAIRLVAVRIIATGTIDDDPITAGVDDRVEALTVAAPLEEVATDFVAADLGLEAARSIAAVAIAALAILAADVVAGTLFIGTALTVHNLIVTTGLDICVVANAATTFVEHVATDTGATNLWIETALPSAAFTITAFVVVTAGVLRGTVEIDAAGTADDGAVATGLRGCIEALAVATGEAEIAAHVVTADLWRETAVPSAAFTITTFVVVAAGVFRGTVGIDAT
jgi:hypothetical protein